MRLRRYLTPAEHSWHKAMERGTIKLEIVDPLVRQMEHFAQVIRGEAKPLVTTRDGLQNLRVVEAIAEAARSGRVISLA